MTLTQRIEKIRELDAKRTQGAVEATDNFIEVTQPENTRQPKRILAGFDTDNPMYGDSSNDTYFYAAAPEMVSIINELLEQNERLKGYGRHKSECDVIQWGIGSNCTCGLTSLIEDN